MHDVNNSESSMLTSCSGFTEPARESSDKLLSEVNSVLTSFQPARLNRRVENNGKLLLADQLFLKMTDDRWHSCFSPSGLPAYQQDKDGTRQEEVRKEIEQVVSAEEENKTSQKSDKQLAQDLLSLLKEGKWNDKVIKQVEHIFKNCDSPQGIIDQISDDIEDDTAYYLSFRSGKGLNDPETIKLAGKKPSTVELQITLEKQLSTGEGEFLQDGWKLKTKDGVTVQCKYRSNDNKSPSYEVKDGGITYKIEWSKEKDRYKLTAIDANGNKSEHLSEHTRRRGLHQTYKFPAVGLTLDEGTQAWSVKIALPKQKEIYICDQNSEKLSILVRKPKN